MLSLLFLVEERGYIESAFLYFAVYTCAVVVMRIVGGRLGDRKGPIVVIPMIALSLIGSVPLVFSGSVVCLLVGALTMALGQGSAFAVLQAEAVKSALKEEVGKASNTFLIILDLGMFAAPIAGGFVLGAFDCSGLFAANSLCLLAGLIVAIRTIAFRVN